MNAVAYLAGAIRDTRWNYSPVTIHGNPTPCFNGTVSEFITLHPELTTQLSNSVRVCAKCGKSCGKTLRECNNCASNISTQPIVRTDNALMGFVYGIEASDHYYLGTSIRYQSESSFVYDDIMQTTVIHLNAIPTTVYIPDFRYLFNQPRRAIELVKSLYAISVESAVKMLSDEAFRQTFYSPAALEELHRDGGSERFVRSRVLAGFNYPPSQCQLHLQFIVPPYMPYHAVLQAQGKHTDINRFFPYRFILDVLEALDRNGDKIAFKDIEELSGIELIAFLGAKVDIDYYPYYHAVVAANKANTEFSENWKKEDFEYIVESDGTVVPIGVSDGEHPTPFELQKRDKPTLESYGKGNGLLFYSFAKSPGEVAEW